MTTEEKELTADRVVEELAAIGFTKVPDCLKLTGDRLTLMDSLTAPEKAAIASVERTSTGLKVRFYDKLKALELLGKHMGLFDGSGRPPDLQTNLLDMILEASREEVQTDDLPEVQ